MPNQPRPDNPGRVIRFDNALWSKVVALAERQGVRPSHVVREAVKRYVRRPPRADEEK